MNIRRIAALVWWLVVIVASNTIVIIPNAEALPTTAQSNISFTTPQQGIIKQLQAAKIIY